MSTVHNTATEITTDTVRQIIAETGGLPEIPTWKAIDAISGIDVSKGRILVALTATAETAPLLEKFRADLENTLANLPGIDSAQVILTAESAPKAETPPQSPPKIGRHATGQAIDLPGVKTVIAIASGKGGVGKSTTTANLAMALKASGLSVGILDADIYGPSIPTLFGCQDQRPSANDEGKLLPIESHGIKLTSIGFMVDPNSAMIWRGPMASGAIEQLFRDVAWGELDVLLLDLPPGTGDIQLTIAQKAPVTGAIIVSTPQDLALIDAKRALTMFQKVEIPVFGIIENMSSYICPNCGHEEHIFDHGGAETAAAETETTYLGGIPLTMSIRKAADDGEPITSAAPDSPQAKAYLNIADKLLDVMDAKVS